MKLSLLLFTSSGGILQLCLKRIKLFFAQKAMVEAEDRFTVLLKRWLLILNPEAPKRLLRPVVRAITCEEDVGSIPALSKYFFFSPSTGGKEVRKNRPRHKNNVILTLFI